MSQISVIAPIFIYSNSQSSDRIHQPWIAVMMRNKAEKLGIPCVALGGVRNQLPRLEKGKKWLKPQLEFSHSHLSN